MLDEAANEQRSAHGVPLADHMRRVRDFNEACVASELGEDFGVVNGRGERVEFAPEDQGGQRGR